MSKSNSITEDFAIGFGAVIIGFVVLGIVAAIGLIGWNILGVIADNITVVAIVLGVVIGGGMLFVMFALFGRFLRQSLFKERREYN